VTDDHASISPVRADLRARVRERSARARSEGYFWLPCPVCGEQFGGFECSRLSVPNGQPGGGMMTCLACEYEVGIRESSTCREHGHVPTEVWAMVTTSHSVDRGRHEVSGTIDLGGPPSERYCAVCFVDLPTLGDS
jgi:hypothetical protein